MTNVPSFTRARPERLLWWLAAAAAVASIIVGILFLVWPDETLLVGAALFGIWLIVHGVIHVIRAVTTTASDGGIRALDGVVGVVFVVIGVICLRNLLASLLAVATIIGIAWLISGLVTLLSAFAAGNSRAERLFHLILGGVIILGGLAVLLWPDLTLRALVYVTGIWLIVIGALQIFLVVRARP
jgi:uncharacterized membrane protein HdeD (DUF308 family)